MLLCLIKFFFNIESLKLDRQFLSIVFSEYRNYYLLFFDKIVAWFNISKSGHCRYIDLKFLIFLIFPD